MASVEITFLYSKCVSVIQEQGSHLFSILAGAEVCFVCDYFHPYRFERDACIMGGREEIYLYSLQRWSTSITLDYGTDDSVELTVTVDHQILICNKHIKLQVIDFYFEFATDGLLW